MTRSPKPRALVVDDRNQNRYILSRILQNAGFSVEECSTGLHALEMVRTLPDLVILDIKLPDLSGYEVCSGIKTDPFTKNVPVLLTSAVLEPQSAASVSERVGAEGYLIHPYVSSDVISKIKRIVDVP